MSADNFIHYAPVLITIFEGRHTVSPSVCGLKCGDTPGESGPLLTSSIELVNCPTCKEKSQ